MVSQTIRNMLTSPGSFAETELGEVTFPEISTTILEKICQYFYWSMQYARSPSILPCPNFVVCAEFVAFPAWSCGNCDSELLGSLLSCRVMWGNAVSCLCCFSQIVFREKIRFFELRSLFSSISGRRILLGNRGLLRSQLPVLVKQVLACFTLKGEIFKTLSPSTSSSKDIYLCSSSLLMMRFLDKFWLGSMGFDDWL